MQYHRSNQNSHRIIARSIVAFTILSLFGFYYTSEPLPSVAVSDPFQDTAKAGDTIYHGFGNEPGWHLLVTTSGNSQLSYRLLLDYGEIELQGSASCFDSDDYPGISWFVLEDAEERVWVAITKESCISAMEVDHGTSVELTYKEKEYHGCGSYKEYLGSTF